MVLAVAGSPGHYGPSCHRLRLPVFSTTSCFKTSSAREDYSTMGCSKAISADATLRFEITPLPVARGDVAFERQHIRLCSLWANERQGFKSGLRRGDCFSADLTPHAWHERWHERLTVQSALQIHYS